MLANTEFLYNTVNLPIPVLLAVIVLAVILGIVPGYFYGQRQLKHAQRLTERTQAAPHDQPLWHVMSVAQALAKQNTNPTTGLTQPQVAQRLAHYGINRLAEKPARPIWHLLLSQFKSLLILVLIAAAILAAAMGDLIDGVVILTVVAINALLGFYQEFQAEKSLAALKNMLALQATVRRDGIVATLPAEQIVPGDIVILEAGDKIPADGRIISAGTLEVDESSLTGESQPVDKQPQPLAHEATPIADRSNMLYMNNSVTRGRCEMLATETGMATEIGRLAALLSAAEDGDTPLQMQLDSLGKRLALIALLVVIVLFATALWRGEPLIETAFTAIALAVAAIPEGLPAVVTVTLALGMHRMARQQAIVKRLAAVETLGCTTVICTDKTGTLTVNQMTARTLYYKNQTLNVTGEGYALTGGLFPAIGDSLPADMHTLLLPLALCNNSHLQDGQIVGDPMEAALLVLAAKGGVDKTAANGQLPRIAELPFDAGHKFMATFHQQGDTVIIYVKGAPEVLVNYCQTLIGPDNAAAPLLADGVLLQNQTMASTGLRVLGVAMRSLAATEFSAQNNLFGYIENLTFVALVGLMDPPRTEAKDAIRLCQRAGIAVKMITGDQKVTAFAIAKELGLQGDIIGGEELASLSDEALAERIKTLAIFARTAPEQKVRIVNALKAAGHIVAMTGDGVNDAPALKSADIGIAMGISGTDVAREAATMVLTDDNFATIVKAIKEGRGIYENMVKFVRFQLSTNIGAILTVASAPLLGLPVPFSAVQLLWINIIMDGPPAMSLSLDPFSPTSMNESPRDPEARMLSWQRFGNLLTFGLIMAVGTLGVLYYSLQTGDAAHATTLAFTTFVLFQVFNVFNARAEKHSAFNRYFFANKMLWLAIFAVLALQIVVIHWPQAHVIFHTTALTPRDWLMACGVAATILVFEELRKLLARLLGLGNKKMPSSNKGDVRQSVF